MALSEYGEKWLAQRRAADQPTTDQTTDYLLWLAETGNSAQMLDALRGVLRQYVAFPDAHSSAAVTLWIAATHALPAFECAPRLVISSPGKRCGKTRLLDLIEYTSFDPVALISTSTAAIYRELDKRREHPPTLLIDESDAIFGTRKAAENNEDLRALINAGHQRGKTVLRCVGANLTPARFPVFAMVALAGIGAMPDTVTDRAVNVAMKRRSRAEPVAKFRSRRDRPVLAELRDRLAAWAAERIPELTDAFPAMPVEDRAADTWEPLVAVADAAGGHWPTTARNACIALVADAEHDDDTLTHRLLTDIRTAYAERGNPVFLPTKDLLWSLKMIDESPWNDPRDPLTPRKLAGMLRDYKIEPQRDTTGNVRGYRLPWFADAFNRYLLGYPSDASDASNIASISENTFDGNIGFDGLSVKPDLSVNSETAAQGTFLTAMTDLTDTPLSNGSEPTDDGTVTHAQALLRVVRQLGGRVISDTPQQTDERTEP